MQKQHPFNCYFFLKIKDENNNNNNDDDDKQTKRQLDRKLETLPSSKVEIKINFIRKNK